MGRFLRVSSWITFAETGLASVHLTRSRSLIWKICGVAFGPVVRIAKTVTSSHLRIRISLAVLGCVGLVTISGDSFTHGKHHSAPWVTEALSNYAEGLTERTNKVSNYKLAERAVLMRLSCGLPGKSRKDRVLTESVKSEHSMGRESGSWIKQKYPKWALEPLEKLVNEARAYHAAVTLPFDAGIGILPAGLILDYGNKMREFKGRFEHLKDSHFVARYPDMIEWAKLEHNGTFDASDYPEVAEVAEAFHFKTEPLPVPDAAHFEGAMSSLLGVDAEGVNVRIKDAMDEAQKELMRRLIAPVKAMAVKLAEAPKDGREDIVFRDTLIGNVLEIAGLAPKLNLKGDAQIDGWAGEILGKLGHIKPDAMRSDKALRKAVLSDAESILKRMESYNL
jgi:hypothetical protein